MTQAPLIITIADFRACGICPQARHWFVKHGLDWRDFARHGIDVEKLRATQDYQSTVERVAQAAQARIGANG